MNTQQKIDTMADVLSVAALTEVYNLVLGRNVKKLSSKGDGIKALKKYAKENKDFELSSFVKKFPKNITAILEQEGLLANDDKPKVAPKKEAKPIEQIDIDPDGSFRFNTKVGVGEYMCKLIIGKPTEEAPNEVNGLLDPDKILAKVKSKFPESNATYADVACNKTDVRKMGFNVPIFRSVKK